MPAGQTRRRIRSALAPAGFAFLAGLAVAVAPPPPARADSAPATPAPSYTRAYVALGAGAALTGVSFVLAEQADRDYARYLAETDPARLEDAYQAARRNDRLSAATLIAGQAGLALGVYWRFLHRPGGHAALQRAAATWRVAPRFAPDGAGLAIDVRF